VITRDGRAVAVIDWEFAAPGRRVWDVVSTARFMVPFASPERRDPAYAGLDVHERLHLFLDAYGLSDPDRAVFTAALDQRRRAGQAFTRHRVALGEPAFVSTWDTPEGRRRLDAERAWVGALPPDVARSGGRDRRSR
jgi:aminoglycoside phosphotransferase (APT) family kinase protein